MRKILLSLSCFTLMMSCCSTENPIKNNKQSKPIVHNGYWQQQADYKMEIDMDVDTYQFKGKQNIKYTNNSPDVLDKVFYHLYFNAFQPNSEMDARVQSIRMPDSRFAPNVGTRAKPIYESRIARLKPSEIGYIEIVD